MMNGGDLYELAKILGHSNIKMTERYAKLAKHHNRQNREHRSGNLEAIERRVRQNERSLSMCGFCARD